MDITIREATANDYNSLCELFDEIDAFHRENLPHIFQKPGGPARDLNYFKGLIADESVCLLVAAEEARLVGYVHAFIRDTPAIPILVPRRFAVIDSIVVKSGLRHRGIGKMLMSKVQGWAITKGATSIELNVYEFNETAISFYKSRGYQTISRKLSKELKKQGESDTQSC